MPNEELQQAIAWFENRLSGATMPGARKMLSMALSVLGEKLERDKEHIGEATEMIPEPANEPLALDELQELWNKDKSKPFWIEFNGDECSGYMELHHYVEDDYFNAYYFGNECDEALMFSGYGETWLAYRYKPKEAQS